MDKPEDKIILFTCLHVIEDILEPDSSDSVDEDISVAFTVKKRKRNQAVLVSNFVQIIDQFNNEPIRKNFRLDRGTFEFLLEEIRDSLINKSCFGRRQNKSCPKLQLLITLWFFLILIHIGIMLVQILKNILKLQR